MKSKCFGDREAKLLYSCDRRRRDKYECQRSGGGGQCVGSAMEAGMSAAAAATAVLPPRAATVATKTPAATAMAGAARQWQV